MLYSKYDSQKRLLNRLASKLAVPSRRCKWQAFLQEDVAKYYTKSTPHTLKESPQTAVEAVYAPGKTLAVADALSRGPLEQTGDEHLEEDVTVHIGAVLSHLPATPRKLQQIRDHTIQDPELQLVKQLTQTGWSEYERRVPEDRKEMRSADAAAKLKQAFYYNRRNGVRHLPPLDPGEGVLMKLDNEKQWTTQGTVQGNCSTPRSYVVVTPEGGCYRRNRRHLLRLPAASKNPNPSGSPDDPLPVSSDVGSKSVESLPPKTGTVTITRSGRRRGMVAADVSDDGIDSEQSFTWSQPRDHPFCVIIHQDPSAVHGFSAEPMIKGSCLI
uniref:Uncharacterized protein n=1 Tax=Knipowitschia caucasica TaxID=637954 RepID=A0AAV2J5W3_KNICA